MRVSISRVEDGKITTQESAGMAIITIHRPQSKNALTADMWSKLAQIGRAIMDNPKTRVVIVRGAGDQFSVGADIKEFYHMSIKEANQAFTLIEEAISTFEQLPLPTIGIINGYALGAGFIFSLVLDLRIGTSTTVMGIPIGRLGITLNNTFTKRMVDIIGPSRCKELVYTGRLLKAEECERLGLVNYLLSKDENAEQFAIRLAKTIGDQSPASLQAVKKNVAFCRSITHMPWGFPSFAHPQDFPEGVKAFIERRKPSFRREINVTTGRN